MDHTVRLLFVCLGNICRSPAAENIFRQLVRQEGLSDRITCDSAGILSLHTGKKPDARMTSVLRKRGYEVAGSARGVERADFGTHDLIVAMDRQNRQDLLALAGTAEERDKVRMLTDFCRDHDHDAVPDPYYGGIEGFELVADLIEDGTRGLLTQAIRALDGKPPKP